MPAKIVPFSHYYYYYYYYYYLQQKYLNRAIRRERGESETLSKIRSGTTDGARYMVAWSQVPRPVCRRVLDGRRSCRRRPCDVVTTIAATRPHRPRRAAPSSCRPRDSSLYNTTVTSGTALSDRPIIQTYPFHTFRVRNARQFTQNCCDY